MLSFVLASSKTSSPVLSVFRFEIPACRLLPAPSVSVRNVARRRTRQSSRLLRLAELPIRFARNANNGTAVASPSRSRDGRSQMLLTWLRTARLPKQAPVVACANLQLRRRLSECNRMHLPPRSCHNVDRELKAGFQKRSRRLRSGGEPGYSCDLFCPRLFCPHRAFANRNDLTLGLWTSLAPTVVPSSGRKRRRTAANKGVWRWIHFRSHPVS